MNVMEELFLSENHLVLSRIFLALDGRSLKSARLVCRRWDRFIREHIWGCTLYRDILRSNLDASWRRNRPSKSELLCQAPVFDIAADSRQIVVSLEDGQIEIWDRSGGDTEGTEHALLKTIKTGCHHGLRLGLTPTLIVGGFFEQNIRAFHRLTGELLQLHPVVSSVHGLTVRAGDTTRERQTLALVSMVSGQVAIFDCAATKLLEETETISSGIARGPNHMSCDGQWLLFGGSKRDLVLYDLDQRREVRRLHNRYRVWSLKMCYPLAASSGVQRSRRDDDAPGGEWEVDLRLGGGDSDDGAGDDNGSGGVLIWNLVEGQIVRRIKIRNLVTLAMDQRRLVLIRGGDVIMLRPSEEKGRLTRIARLPRWAEDAPAAASGHEASPGNGNWSMAGALLERDRLIAQAGRKEQVVVLDYWLSEGAHGDGDDDAIADSKKLSTSGNPHPRWHSRLLAVASAAVVIPVAWVISRWSTH